MKASHHEIDPAFSDLPRGSYDRFDTRVRAADDEERREIGPVFFRASRVAAVVSELREIVRRGELDRSLAIGQLVLDRFFGGSAEIWRDRRRNKNNSVRRIAEHPDCPLSRSALNEAIAVYVAVQALPCDRTSGHILAGHVAAVSSLQPEHQCEWLERADKERWSVRQLKKQLRFDRLERGERRGRPLAEPERRLLAGVKSAVGALRRALAKLWEMRCGPDLEQELNALADELTTLAQELRCGMRAVRSEPCASKDVLAKAKGVKLLESAG